MAKLTKKEIIFQAAARLFKDYGYQATSMRQLAKEVGLEASSLYSHISSKQELLAQICMSEANKYLNHMNKVMKEDEGIIDILRAMSFILRLQWKIQCQPQFLAMNGDILKNQHWANSEQFEKNTNREFYIL